jgi:hypothetical protein
MTSQYFFDKIWFFLRFPKLLTDDCNYMCNFISRIVIDSLVLINLICLVRPIKIACELIKFSTGNLPSSALTPIFEEVLFVPRRCLQKSSELFRRGVKFVKIYPEMTSQ